MPEWRGLSLDSSPGGWVFASENSRTPLRPANCWKWNFRPRLELLGLEWITFQVMRRTHSTLQRAAGIDPKVVADQQGHSLRVNLDVYTKSSLETKDDAVSRLEVAEIANGV